MVNPSRSPLPLNIPYHRSFNYPKYVKDSDLNVHVKVFKDTIKANNELDDVKIVNMFIFTLKDFMYDYSNNYMGDYPY
jgi:hypothetical protein